MTVSTLALFPSSYPGQGVPSVRVPIWHSIVQESVGGVETVQQPWTYPQYGYEINFTFLRQASAYGEIQGIIGFYNQQGARNGVWQFTDFDDYVVTTQSVAVGDGVTTSWQLVRTFGGFTEPVFAVSTVTAVSNGGSSASSTQYTISNKGILSFSTFTPAVGSTIAWAGTYNWYCRFTEDQNTFSQFTVATDRQGPIWELRSLKFKTVKFGA